ncbi:MAG: type IV pilin protein [Burkholderiaceae bacterium]
MTSTDMRAARAASKTQQGFSFIELLVTMVIVGIITAVAVPSYGSYVLRTARADARATMLQVNQFMERFYAMNSAYDQRLDGAAVALPPALTTVPSGAAKPRFIVSIDAATLTPNSYTIQAVPANASASDTCGTLTLSSVGARGASGTSTAAELNSCWK